MSWTWTGSWDGTPIVTDAWLGAELLADYVLELERLQVRIRGPATVPPSRDP